MNDLTLNLISEGIGVIVELAIAYFLIDYMIRNNERKKWAPARRIIVRKVALTYIMINRRLEHLITIGGVDQRHFEMRRKSLKNLKEWIVNLHRTLDLNNSALDSSLMPAISVFLEVTDRIFKKLNFILLAYDPKNEHDIVGEPPFEDIELLTDSIVKLKKGYSNVLMEANVTIPDFMTLDELKKIWDLGEERNDRLFLDPKKYRDTTTPDQKRMYFRIDHYLASRPITQWGNTEIFDPFE